MWTKSKTGCLLTESPIYEDGRGYFLETFKGPSYLPEFNVKNFEQDNISVSKKNVVRGLHFNTIKPQAKLVRVLSGAVIDFVIDLRPESETFGLSEHFLLKSMNQALFIPAGFAHSFWALERDTVFSYKCSEAYCAQGEAGINPLDPEIHTPWKGVDVIVSSKDKELPTFKEVLSGIKN